MTSTDSPQAAYLLHHKVQGDTSFMVELFSLNHGRVTLIAKSARASKPRTRALYQPFRPLLVSWWGEGAVKTLTGIEESGSAIELTGQALACAYYLNELVIRLVGKDQPQAHLFAHYSLALSELHDNPDAPQPVLRRFELHLLEALGLLPDFRYCVDKGSGAADKVEADTGYLYYPSTARAIEFETESDMAIPKRKSPPVVYHADGETIEKGIPINGTTLLKMADLDIDSDDVVADMKLLMRTILHQHLGDKPLRSRSMFAGMTPPPAPSTSHE